MAYRLQGRLVELCTCGASCPCQVTGEPDGGTCEAVNAWHIDQGAINQIDVSGLTLVVLNHVHGHILQGRSVVFYVDDQATDRQQEALLAVWTGQLGGPVADLAQLIGDVAGVERASIAFDLNGSIGSLQVAQSIDARLAPSESEPLADIHGRSSHGPMPESVRRYSDVCTTVAGSQTLVGEAAVYRVNSPSYGFTFDLRNHKVITGHFSFQG